jgi:parallel beta-helix repeat protein
MNKKFTTLLGISFIVANFIGCNISDYSYNESSKSDNKKIINVQDVNTMYENGLIPIYNDDKKSIIEKYKLPSLERMSTEDQDKFVNNEQVIKRIDDFKIATNDFYTPENNWKSIYNTSKQSVYDKVNSLKIVEFSGTTGSELNRFIEENTNSQILITSSEIMVDEPINIKSNIFLKGNGNTKLICNAPIDKAIILDKVENSGISGLKIDGNFNYGVYIIQSNNVLIKENNISNVNNKAIVVMGKNSYVNIISNYIHENKHGAIFINGNSSYGVIEGNTLLNNDGKENLTAGIVLASLEIKDMYTAYNKHQDIYLYDLKDAPNNNVIKDNLIENGHSSGIYSDGGYMNYIVENEIRNNDKEGICLDYGTFGTYVYQNKIISNGGRSRQSDEDLERDFIGGFGRLEDGSSPAKLPGISIDNAAYNIIKDNIINLNYGSGIKMVRSGYRNIIMMNNISDNNAGESDKFHFFGIELGHASEPDKPVKGLDFTADYENIICRNTISGVHYSGIFIAEECYINDIFDNTIMDSEMFSIESLTDKFNSSVNNLANKESRGISLSNSVATIVLPNSIK